MSKTKLAVMDGQTLMDTMRFEKRRCPAQKTSLQRGQAERLSDIVGRRISMG